MEWCLSLRLRGRLFTCSQAADSESAKRTSATWRPRQRLQPAELLLGVGLVDHVCVVDQSPKVAIQTSCRIEGPRLDVMEVFTIASEGSKRALGEYEAMAYVDVYAGDLLGFTETVAVNRGMPVAVFSSVEDAKQWLRHQKECDDQDIFLRDREP